MIEIIVAFLRSRFFVLLLVQMHRLEKAPVIKSEIYWNQSVFFLSATHCISPEDGS